MGDYNAVSMPWLVGRNCRLGTAAYHIIILQVSGHEWQIQTMCGTPDGSPTLWLVAGLSSYLDQTGTTMTLFAPTNAALTAAGLDVRCASHACAHADRSSSTRGEAFRLAMAGSCPRLKPIMASAVDLTVGSRRPRPYQ